MTKEELKELLKENLAVSIDRDTGDGSVVGIKIYFDDELITEDYYFG